MATRLKNRMGDELERLIKAIGDCKSKSEEDRILYRSIESTKASIKSGKVDKQKTRDFLIKLLYFEMLGHDAAFGHFLAVQACGSNVVMTKLVGHLAVSQFVDSSDSLILLLVNTWMSDLQNDNHIIVSAALTAVCKLVNSETIGALVPLVVKLTAHPKEGVRKKAIMALHRFCQIDPQCEGGMSGIDINTIFRNTLCDKDPSVMAATLCAMHELAKRDPYPYRNLIPSLTSIIKQVIEHRLSKTYEYHHCPAPFVQIRVLRILGALGDGDKPSTDNMRNVLLSVMKHANPRNTIGFAILFECIRTITTVSPDTTLLETAAKSIFTFLRTDNSHNLKYMGLDALGGIVSINFRQAQEHQTAVMDCLEDPDDTLKLKTLELLYKMTTASNVEIVVDKLIQYLRTCSDEHITKDICERVSYLAERYAPATLWYVEAMMDMFDAAGDAIPADSGHNLMKLIAEQEEDVHKSVVEICLTLTERPKLPRTLRQVVCWVLGEYGTLAEQIESSGATVVNVQERMCELVQTSNPDETLQGYILTALLKLTTQYPGSLAIDAEDLVHKSTTSKSTDLQQRALEMQSFGNAAAHTAKSVLPFDASCEDLGDQLTEIQSLSFLDAYVQDAAQKGAASYVPDDERDDFRVSLTPAETDTPSGGLRYDAYTSPTIPQMPFAAGSGTPNVPDPFPVEVPVSSFSAGSEPTLVLPAGARRWGPAAPEAVEAPVIHLNTMKVEYSQPDVPMELEDQTNGTAELSDRDVFKASLFGEVTPKSTSRGSKFLDRTGQRSPERRTKSVTTPPKKSEPLPELDLLDMSDPRGTTTETTQAQSDPFAGMDLLSGVNGTGALHAAPPPAPVTQPIDLDALYGPSRSNVMNNVGAVHAVPPVMPMTPPMGHHTLTPGFGLKTGIASSMPNLNKPTTTTKDDPFKDLLG